jgi:carbamoyl-phosphate synthase small subunit
MSHNRKKAILVLADGTTFKGDHWGAEGETIGEVVFNTSMMGYQEILTDPSYHDQIVTMTNPMMGNYGITPEDVESRRCFVRGFIVKEPSTLYSNWRAKMSLDQYLKEQNVVGLCGIDTRKLTRIIRDEGAQQGIISSVDFDVASLQKKAQGSRGLIGVDLVKEVTCEKAYDWDEGTWDLSKGYQKSSNYSQEGRASKPFRVIAMDFGIKQNILRNLVASGCQVKVVPANTSSKDILAENPDGIFLSNGPGDPDAVPYGIQTVRELLGKKPMFGICLGHQIMALALGGKTFKLKFGHRGGNQPVMDLATKKVEITAQNHGFAVDYDSLKSVAEITHVNLNDQTVEGLTHKKYPLFSVQYHPESSPGPHDSQYLFERFVDIMKKASV